MAKIRVTQVKSKIGRPKSQKRTILGFRFKKMNHSVEHNATPQIRNGKESCSPLKVEEVK